MINQQLLLDLQFSKLSDWRDFYVTKSNSEAVQWLQHFLSIDINILWIYGDEKSGKSHLGKLWANSVFARCIIKRDLSIDSIEELLQENNFFYIDDADLIKVDEEWFFHFFNYIIYANNPKLKILIMSRKRIINLGVTLKDLSSRLMTATEIHINAPDDELIKKLIWKAFFEYGIRCSDSDINFISSRINRTYVDIFEFIDNIHRLKIESNKPLLKVVKNLLYK